MPAQNGIKMLQLFAYIVLFWVVMPALLYGLGKVVDSYMTVQPATIAIATQPKTRKVLVTSDSD